MKEHYFSTLDGDEAFTDNGMVQYLNSFNAIEKKYRCLVDSIDSIKSILSEYEFSHSYSNITKSKFSHITDNLQLVYGDNDITSKDVFTFHQVETKIVQGFLGIQNVDKLFDEDYFNFEWDMHVQRNFKEHQQGYYRDHFIHQVRNLYMCDILLDNYGFYNATKSVLMNRYNSKISEYVCKKYQQFKNDKYSNISHLISNICSYIGNDILQKKSSNKDETVILLSKAVLEVKNEEELIGNVPRINIEKFAKNLFNTSPKLDWKTIIEKIKTDSSLSNSRTRKRIAEIVAEYAQTWYSEEYFFNYIIYASIYMSALFHDLSYPVCYFLQFRQRLSEYCPSTYMFTHNSMESFDILANKLGNSLLFTIVSNKELENRMQMSDKQVYDHGVYSAIAFLTHFYESGLIQSLSIEKQCAIELAAVAIYNHTLKFDCIEIGASNNYYKPYFNQNPIAFLLRFCDDIQEWDRRYFEINGDSDLLFCPDCQTPMLKHKDTKAKDGSKNKYIYKCFCKNSKDSDFPYRYEEFLKRKIFIIRVCSSLSFDIIESETNQKLLRVQFNYDLYKMLLMSRYSYAKYRLEDMNGLKKILTNNNFRSQSDTLDVPETIYLEYILSSNPVFLKVKILEKWLLKREGISHVNLYEYLFANQTEIQKLFYDFCASLRITSTVELAFKDHLIWYFKILLISLHARRNADLLSSDRTFTVSRANMIMLSIPKYSSNISDEPYLTYTKTLVEDCINQYMTELDPKDSDDYTRILMYLNNKRYLNKYENYCKSKDLLYDVVLKYNNCNTSNISKDSKLSLIPCFNEYYDNVLQVNYYSDLYVFYKLNQEIYNNNNDISI